MVVKKESVIIYCTTSPRYQQYTCLALDLPPNGAIIVTRTLFQVAELDFELVHNTWNEGESFGNSPFHKSISVCR